MLLVRASLMHYEQQRDSHSQHMATNCALTSLLIVLGITLSRMHSSSALKSCSRGADE